MHSIINQRKKGETTTLLIQCTILVYSPAYIIPGFMYTICGEGKIIGQINHHFGENFIGGEIKQ